MKCKESNLVLQEDVEGEGKSHNVQEEDREELHKGVADVSKHHNINAKSGKLPDEQHKINPCKENGNCSQLPLPVLIKKNHKGLLRSECG